MTTELRNCPFCNGTNVINEGEHAFCEDCDVRMWIGDEGVSAWNTRPIEDGLQAEIDRLKAKVAELESYKQLRNEIYANDISVLMGIPLTIEVVDRNTDRHFIFSSDWGLIKDDGGWEATRQLILDRFENWREG